jgi:hypothetical protein
MLPLQAPQALQRRLQAAAWESELPICLVYTERSMSLIFSLSALRYPWCVTESVCLLDEEVQR